jgi:hypothetical protein
MKFLMILIRFAHWSVPAPATQIPPASSTSQNPQPQSTCIVHAVGQLGTAETKLNIPHIHVIAIRLNKSIFFSFNIL